MSYRMKTEGLKELIDEIKALGDSAWYIGSFALYEGAAVMADAIDAEAKTIETEPFHYAAVTGATMRKASPEEKAIVTESDVIGIAKFRKRLGAVDTSVGYNSSGYAPVNWNHMSSKARTNYKAQSFKGFDNMTTSTLKFAGVYKRGVQNMKPIGVIANAINSGTSFMHKDPFMRRAYRKGEQKAIEAIIRKGEEMIDQIIESKESGGKSA